MSPDDRRRASVKIAAVAAEAQSLADDLRDGKLWEGDASRRMSLISENLSAAMQLTHNDR